MYISAIDRQNISFSRALEVSTLATDRVVASKNGSLGVALGPYTRVVTGESTDVQVVTWTPVRDGAEPLEAVSIQGIRNGRVLGIIVFR